MFGRSHKVQGSEGHKKSNSLLVKGACSQRINYVQEAQSKELEGLAMMEGERNKLMEKNDVVA